MTKVGLVGLNTRTNGVSRDQECAAFDQIGGALALVHNDADLIVPALARGMQVVWRQDDDEHGLLDGTDADLQARAEAFTLERIGQGATYAHLTNEVASSPALQTFTRYAIDCALRNHARVVPFNYGTHASRAAWEESEANVRYAIEHDLAIGAHVYLDGTHDATAFEFAWLKQKYGGTWLITEYASIQDYRDSGRGARGVMDDAAYAAWLNKSVEKVVNALGQDGLALFLFSFDDWPANDFGKREGFGVHDRPQTLDALRDLNVRYVFRKGNPTTVYPVGSAPVLKQIAFSDGLKLRNAPSLTGATLCVLRQGENVTVYAEPKISADGYPWQRVTSASNEQGWSASSVGGSASFVDLVTWTTDLTVPYVSQTAADAAMSPNDCAIACLLMLIRRWLVTHGRPLPSLPTVDDLTRHTVLSASAPPKGLTFAQVEALALQLGFSTHYQQPASLDWIKSQLDESHLVVVLLDYGVFHPGHGSFAHFVVVKGYNEAAFCCHDPYLGGADFNLPAERLIAALHTVPANSLPDQAFTLTAD